MKPYAIIDSSQKPVVSVTFTGERGSDENFQQYLEDLESCYVERKSIAIIFNASEAVIPKLTHQKKQALWISIHWKLIQTYCKGTAYVIPNRAIRAVLKMIFNLQHQPAPYQIFSNISEAESWVQHIMAAPRQASTI
jgi:hypothetical protein